MRKTRCARALCATVSFVAGLAAIGLAAVPVQAAETVTLSPVEDATVRADRATTNYGSAATLEVDGEPRKRTLLRFDLTAIGASSVARASLRLHALDGSTAGGTVTSLGDASWQEETVTWDTAPNVTGTVVGSFPAVTANQWYEIEVTDAVRGSNSLTLAIASSNSNGADYASKERTSATAPQLIVETGGGTLPGDQEPPSAPSGLTATEVGAGHVSLRWTAATDNVGVEKYRIHRNGTAVGEVAGTTYTDHAVASATTYRYVVRALDAAGNLSAASNEISVTTLAGGTGGRTTFMVTREGSTYRATAQTIGVTYSGALKSVVEQALDRLRQLGGGRIEFTAGEFDLGSSHFEIDGITDVEFVGQGMGVTTIRNFTNASADTEPFDAVRSDRLTIRDLTVAAGGSDRTTSDALDFDGGDDILIERVAVTDSRGRGIVFDGKDAVSSTGGTALRNVVRDCVVSGTPRDGIQLLAAEQSRIEGCRITGTGAEGIRVHLASSSAAQPNKPSNDNVVVGNVIRSSAGNGIAVTSGNRNVIAGNVITSSGQNGIRIFTSISSLTCNDNRVEGNEASMNRYGLSIESSQCHRTVVTGNDFAGNTSGAILDRGTGTIYGTSGADTQAPSAPSSLTVEGLTSASVRLRWGASTDNVGVADYVVYRGTNPVATLAGTVLTYEDTDVTPGATYRYFVRARDASGNQSTASNTVEVVIPATGGGGSLTFAASDDATVRASSSTLNLGLAASLEVDADSRKDTLLRFRVQGIGSAPASRAVLRLFAIDASPVGDAVHKVTDVGWSESTVTWANAPAGDGGLLGSVGGVSAGAWYEVDVTPLVQGDGYVSVRISSSSTNGADYASQENSNGNGPQLVVTP